MDAIDADQDVRAYLAQLRAAGCKAVGRYYSKHAWKVVTQAEAHAISAAGFKVFAVYEDSASSSILSTVNGRDHANRALAYALYTIHQPQGSGIYFAVDFEANSQTQGLDDYFDAINATFAAHGSPYKVGVYAGGDVCDHLLKTNRVSFGWLTQSTSYPGYQAFLASKRWAISQRLPPAGVPHLDADPDDLNPQIPDFGGFQV